MHTEGVREARSNQEEERNDAETRQAAVGGDDVEDTEIGAKVYRKAAPETEGKEEKERSNAEGKSVADEKGSAPIKVQA